MATGRIPINGTAAIQETIVDAKGDLIVGTGADAVARLAVGTNGHTLVADSTVSPTGLKWAAPASGGGMTLLSTTTASASSTITLSSISQDYIHLQIILDNITVSSDSTIRMRFNGDTNTRYRNLLDPLDFNNTFNSDFMRASSTFSSSVAESCSVIDIPRYTNTYSRKYAQYNFFGVNNSTTTNGQVEGFGNLYNQTPAITSITLYPATGTFSGTILLYGVK